MAFSPSEVRINKHLAFFRFIACLERATFAEASSGFSSCGLKTAALGESCHEYASNGRHVRSLSSRTEDLVSLLLIKGQHLVRSCWDNQQPYCLIKSFQTCVPDIHRVACHIVCDNLLLTLETVYRYSNLLVLFQPRLLFIITWCSALSSHLPVWTTCCGPAPTVCIRAAKYKNAFPKKILRLPMMRTAGPQLVATLQLSRAVHLASFNCFLDLVLFRP